MKIAIDVSEYIAMETIVLGMLERMISDDAKAAGVSPQTMINDFSARCAKAIETGEIDAPGSDTEKLRKAAIESLMALLSGITFGEEKTGRAGFNFLRPFILS
jgi:hypothetical protein